MQFVYLAVERIPRQRQPETLYHIEEFEVAGLLCTCGCGHRITLPVPDCHQMFCNDGLAIVRANLATSSQADVLSGWGHKRMTAYCNSAAESCLSEPSNEAAISLRGV